MEEGYARGLDEIVTIVTVLDMAETPTKAGILAVLAQNGWFAALPAALKSALAEKGRVVEVARGNGSMARATRSPGSTRCCAAAWT